MKPIAIDLFAGAGGLSEGLTQAGFKVAVANEKDPWAAKTYLANHPETTLLTEDIRKIDAEQILTLINQKPLLVAGGPPCQGFSMAGRRRNFDERNHLIFEFAKKVKQIRPTFFLIENVTGLLSYKEGRVIEEIEALLTSEGYCVSKRILNASDFGVPQARNRLFIFGSLVPDVDINEWDIPKTKTPSIKDAISDLTFLKNGQNSNEYVKKPSSAYQCLMRGNNIDLHNHQASLHNQKTLKRYSLIRANYTFAKIPAYLKTKKRNLRRLHPNQPANTITTIPDDYIHYALDRTLTVRECARLQSFPDHYVFLGGRTTGGRRRIMECPQYTQVGNAVPPLLAKAIGEWILSKIQFIYKENERFIY